MLSDNHNSDDYLEIRERLESAEQELIYYREISISMATDDAVLALSQPLAVATQNTVSAYTRGYVDALMDRRHLSPHYLVAIAVMQLVLNWLNRRPNKSDNRSIPF
jgi:hypothetical protein